MVAQIIFLSTPSGWRATQKTELFFICTRFLSTPSGWRATADLQIIYRHNKFLSTPSGWRATQEHSRCPRLQVHFYPRPPGGGRRYYRFRFRLCRHFYPRPPGGGRPRNLQVNLQNLQFLSTPSGWRATGRTCHVFVAQSGISIHALRVEGDAFLEVSDSLVFDFYPRPPGGGRLTMFTRLLNKPPFLSTPSGWRATSFLGSQGHRVRISIHALRVEGDVQIVVGVAVDLNFYPRPPGGGRPRMSSGLSNSTLFLSTPSGWRATGDCAISNS